MKKQIKQPSAAIQVMSLVFSNSSRNSWQTLNSELHGILDSLIRLDFEFEIDDYSEIDTRFRGGYWLRVSHNGNHTGEWLYATGTKSYNNSFCLSYEKHTGRVPYQLDNKRVFEGFEFEYDKLFWRVTGWTKDNKNIKCVGYKNRMNKGTKKLIEFDRTSWLKERKQMKTI